MLRYPPFASDDVLLLPWNEKGMVTQITSSETYSNFGSTSNISVIKDQKMGYVAKMSQMSSPIIQVGEQVKGKLSSITLEAWFKWNGSKLTTSISQPTVIVGLATQYGEDGGLVIGLYKDNIYFASDENMYNKYPHAQIKANEWIHLALCYSSSTIRGFINGTLIGSYAVTVKYSKPYWIGGYHNWSCWNNYYYRGSEQLAYARISKKARWKSSFDIRAIFNYTINAQINLLDKILVICVITVILV